MKKGIVLSTVLLCLAPILTAANAAFFWYIKLIWELSWDSGYEPWQIFF